VALWWSWYHKLPINKPKKTFFFWRTKFKLEPTTAVLQLCCVVIIPPNEKVWLGLEKPLCVRMLVCRCVSASHYILSSITFEWKQICGPYFQGSCIRCWQCVLKNPVTIWFLAWPPGGQNLICKMCYDSWTNGWITVKFLSHFPFEIII
jgi:hypothetical protein